MQKLIAGIHRFRSEVFPPQRELFARLALGQHPETLFITCSDSRISPNLLTQTLPGELFILRNAGNVIPIYGVGGGEAATVEYAVRALGVRDVIVCGHSHCGAVTGLLRPELLRDLPATADWLRHAEKTVQIVASNYADLPDDRRLVAAIEENVLVQIEQLQTHPVVAAGVESGTLGLHGWVYKIETGEVFAYDRAAGQFLLLADRAAQQPSRDGGERAATAIL